VERSLEWVLAGKPVMEVETWPIDWRVEKYAIELSRVELYSRIDKRVENMMIDGLWAEASSLYDFRELNALQTVGYREIFACLDGLWSKEVAIEKIKQHTRNYAKRQITWFKKDLEIKWVKSGNQEDMAKELSASQGN
jgi:tRNA dimethylallyltransferase